MQRMISWISQKMAPVKKELTQCFLFTMLWGLAAHGYLFFNNSISHDSIDEFLSAEFIAEKKIRLGRFLVPLVHGLRGDVSAPWWIGMISLICIAIAVFLVIRTFEIREGWKIALVSGIFATNLTITAIGATYIHDLDCDCIAFLLSVAAVYLWRKYKWGFLFGIIPLAMMMGLYQCFISCSITLIIMVCILDLVNRCTYKEVFWKGLRSVFMLIGGGLLYLCMLKIIPIVTGVQLSSGAYNSLELDLSLGFSEILILIKDSYKVSLNKFLHAKSVFPVWISVPIQSLSLFISILFAVCKLFDKTMGTLEKLLMSVLFLLIPLGMNVSQVLSNGMSHDLMFFGIWLFYLLLLFLTDSLDIEQWGLRRWLKEGSQIMAVFLVVSMLWSNVQVANSVHTAKRFIQDANLSLFTRILSHIETVDGYITGDTPVAFIGRPKDALLDLPPQFSKFKMTGYDGSYVIGATIKDHYQYYFRYVLMNPAKIALDSQVAEMRSRSDVIDMPIYPERGSIELIDGILVVKLGD